MEAYGVGLAAGLAGDDLGDCRYGVTRLASPDLLGLLLPRLVPFRGVLPGLGAALSGTVPDPLAETAVGIHFDSVADSRDECQARQVLGWAACFRQQMGETWTGRPVP